MNWFDVTKEENKRKLWFSGNKGRMKTSGGTNFCFLTLKNITILNKLKEEHIAKIQIGHPEIVTPHASYIAVILSHFKMKRRQVADAHKNIQ